MTERVLVTGGASGLGQALAERDAGRGARVFADGAAWDRFLVLPSRDGQVALYGKRFTGPLYHAAMKRIGARLVTRAAERDAAAGRG